MKKVIKNSIVSIILGTVCVLAAIIFAPIWNFWDGCPWVDWGSQIINLLIAACIVCYLVLFLSKRIKGNGKRAIQVLTIIEFALLSLIALGCVCSQFKVINIQGACQIFGLALWTRGTIEIFRAYYYRSDSKENYPLWYLGLSIAMITLGTWCFVKPFIQDVVILWIFVVSLLILGILLLTYGISKRKSKKR